MEEKTVRRSTVLKIAVVMLSLLLAIAVAGLCYVYFSEKECNKECTCNKVTDNTTNQKDDTNDVEYVRFQLESDDLYSDDITVDAYSDHTNVSINGKLLVNDLPNFVTDAYIYRIDDVYILKLSNKEAQCDFQYVVIFNKNGQLLFNYSKNNETGLQVDKTTKLVTIETYDEDWCGAYPEGEEPKPNIITIKINGSTAVLEK